MYHRPEEVGRQDLSIRDYLNPELLHQGLHTTSDLVIANQCDYTSKYIASILLLLKRCSAMIPQSFMLIRHITITT